jgi:PAS domain S-box-containing protein
MVVEQTAVETFGYEKDEAIGQNVAFLFPSEKAQEFTSYYLGYVLRALHSESESRLRRD